MKIGQRLLMAELKGSLGKFYGLGKTAGAKGETKKAKALRSSA